MEEGKPKHRERDLRLVLTNHLAKIRICIPAPLPFSNPRTDKFQFHFAPSETAYPPPCLHYHRRRRSTLLLQLLDHFIDLRNSPSTAFFSPPKFWRLCCVSVDFRDDGSEANSLAPIEFLTPSQKVYPSCISPHHVSC